VHSPQGTRVLDTTLAPEWRSALHAMGHSPGPLIPDDPVNGLKMATVPPRFSTGYGDVRHIPSVLVETHSLKPYEQRVLGTLVLMQSTLQTLGLEGVALKRAAMYDTESRPDPVPIDWRVPPASPNVEMMDYLAVESRTSPSAISGSTRTEYLGRP